MTTPVVVSRIQNRRGTQAQFDALYPAGYNGISGYSNNVPLGPTITTTGTNGTSIIATIAFAVQPLTNLPIIGALVTVTGVTPLAYNGTFTVTSVSTTSISYASTATGSQTVAGSVFKPFTIDNSLSVLQPGELALCLDTQNVYIGNLNGTYTKLATDHGMVDIALRPIVTSLVPSPSSFTVIPILAYTSTPFFNLLYSVVDAVTVDPNVVGTNFSRNGEMKITAVADFVPAPAVPPFPPVTPVTLTDNGTEVNTTVYDISFAAEYGTFGTINLSYMHNFPGNLIFSTSSIIWAPL